MVDQLEISLKDLILKIVLKWRLIIAGMLVCGMLFGGVGAYKNSLLNKSQEVLSEEEEESLEQQIEMLESQLTELEADIVKVSVEEYFSYVKQAEALNAYMNESIFMKLESSSVPTLQKMYQITVKDSDLQDSNAIAKAYVWKLDSADVYEKVIAGLDEINSLACAKELITFSEVADGTFTITVMATDEAQCEEILDVIDARMKKIHSGLKKTYGEYTFVELDTKFSHQSMDDVINKQQETRNTYLDLEDYKQSLDDNFSEQQFAYYDALIALETDEVVEEEVVVPVQVSLINKKYIAVGIILGMLAVCGYIAVMYVFSSRLRKVDDLEIVYGIPTLATIRKQSGKKKLLGGIDKLVYRIFNGKNQTQNDVDDVCINIKSIAQKNQLNKIYLVSSCKSAEIDSFMQNVHEKLASEFEVRSGELVLEEMLSAELIIQFEQTGGSKSVDIQRIVDLARIHGIQIGGSVMFEVY